MKKSLQTIIIALLLQISDVAFAQQSVQAFLESYGATGVQEMFYKTSVIRGTDGFMYVCGATLNSDGNYDMLLTKMTMNNIIVWSQQYAGTAGGDDFAAELVQDSAGNIIITGAEYVSPTNYNAITIKYNNAGAQIWLASYNGAANSFDGGISVVSDASNNIYMCGGSFGYSTLSDFLCIKYNSSGVQLWATTWNSVNMQDLSARLAVSNTQVSVIGASQQSTNDWKMATAFFNPITGAFIGVKLTEGDDEGIDKVADLAIDVNDNTYVVGAVRNVNKGYDMKVIKLSPTYTVLWQQTYNGVGFMDDEGLSLELTSTNDVVVCGFTTTTNEGKNFITRKYNGSTGSLIWSKTFDEQDGEDKATDLKLDGSGNAIICGSSYKDGNLDFVVQKLRNTTGEIVWTGRWNGDFNLNDIPMNLAIDENDNTIYVAGQSDVGAGKYKYFVTEWSQKDIYMPEPVDRKNPNGFITNKGQIQNTDGSLNTSIKYYQPAGWPSTYIDYSKISYVYTKADTLPNDTLQRIDMVFKKGNPNAKVYPTQELPHYTNFYLGYMPNEKSERTSHYNSITKLGVYTNTDVIFTNHSQGYRTWIVARVGSPTGDITLQYDGQNALSVDANGDLVFSTIFGDIVQPKAKVYNMNITTGVLTLLAWQPHYVITGNQVTFNYVGSWSGTLVIEMEKKIVAGGGPLTDPGNIEWSTYYGNDLWDYSWHIDDDEQYVYSCGNTRDTEYPIVPGGQSYQCENCALDNAFLQTYVTSSCALLYSIIVGGNGNDAAGRVLADQQGHVYMTGMGGNWETFHTQPFGTAYYLAEPIGNNGDFSFLTRFNGVTGQMQWSTFITTAGYFTIHPSFALAMNSDGELYMTGQGNSLEGITLSGNGYQFDDDEFSFDTGFILRFNNALEITWATEFGRGCQIYDATVNAQKELVICGSMNIVAIPDFDEFASSGQWTTPFGGDFIDGFFAVFTPANELKWSTWFGGNDSEDGITTVSTTGTTLFFGGYTSSTQNFPLLQSSDPNHYYDDVAAGGDGFIAQFDNEQLIWNTYYGGSASDNVQDIVARTKWEFYVTGSSNSLDFDLMNSIGAYNQDVLNGTIGITKYDSFISCFNNKELLWNTYFGGNEGGTDSDESGFEMTLVNGTKLFVGGSGQSSLEFPWWDFDGSDFDIAYFDDFVPSAGESDSWIARLEIENVAIAVENYSASNVFGIGVFPNPSTHRLFLKFNQALSEALQITVFDSQGKLVLTEQFKMQGQNLISLPIEELANGLYTLHFCCDELQGSVKFIKE